MATVEALWRSVFPAARLLGDAAAGGRSVAWVRVLKARVPAFDALEADDLAIVPVAALANLAAIAVEPTYAIEAVTAAGATGVLVVGDATDPAAAALLEAGAQRGLAALALAEGDVSALERSAIAFIVNARAEIETRAAALELELEQAALAGAGVDGLAAVAARFFARPVAIEAADGTLLAVHAGPEAGPATPAASSYLRNRRGAALRVSLPTGGTLALLGPAPPSELERVASARIAPLLALSLGSAAKDKPARANEKLPGAGPPWVVMVARQIDADAATPAVRSALRSALRQLEPARRLALRGDETSLELRLVAATTSADPVGWELATRVSRRAGRPVVLSETFSDPSERAIHEANARSTLEAFEALPAAERQPLLGADGELVVSAHMLPALRLVGGLAAVPDGARQARAFLRPLLNGRNGRDADALATLRAMLDHAGLAEAAAALGVHRNTLAYRLAVIERRTGWRLSDPLLRFSLGLAIRLVQIDQDRAG
jgi:hypothetical protein